MSKSGRDLVERGKVLEAWQTFKQMDSYLDSDVEAAIRAIPAWKPDVEVAKNSSCRHRALLKSIAGDILDSGGVNRGDYDSMAIVEDVRAEFARLKSEPAPPTPHGVVAQHHFIDDSRWFCSLCGREDHDIHTAPSVPTRDGGLQSAAVAPDPVTPQAAVTPVTTRPGPSLVTMDEPSMVSTIIVNSTPTPPSDGEFRKMRLDRDRLAGIVAKVKALPRVIGRNDYGIKAEVVIAADLDAILTEQPVDGATAPAPVGDAMPLERVEFLQALDHYGHCYHRMMDKGLTHGACDCTANHSKARVEIIALYDRAAARGEK